MAPKKTGRGEDSEYSYVTDEEAGDAVSAGRPRTAPRVLTAAKAAPKATAAKAAPKAIPAPVISVPKAAPVVPEEPRVVTTHGPPCATSKRRIPSPSSSSNSPPRHVRPHGGRESASPARRSPARRSPPRREDVPGDSERSRPTRREVEPGSARDRSTRPVSPALALDHAPEGFRRAASAPPDADHAGERPTRPFDGHGSKGKSKGKRTQDCPHCWSTVAWSPRGAGLSQHMWWNVNCISWQMYSQGDIS